MRFGNLLLIFIAGATAQSCYDSADYFIGERCYTLVNQQLSWPDALNYCRNHNRYPLSTLATVADPKTNTYLASYARTIFNTNDGNYWIGLSRDSSSSRYYWGDGTPLGWTNFEIQTAQNYASGSIKNGKWVSYSAETKFNFICSYVPNGLPSDGPMTSEPTPTPTDDTSCDTHTPTTFVFAYSTDMPAHIVNTAWHALAWPVISPHYTMFGSIRFDVRTEDDFEFHSDWRDVNSTIMSHQPDPSLGFTSNETGSDVLRMIDRWLSTTRAPVCGSKLYIMVKRYPNEVDTSRLVARLRSLHVTFTIESSTTPSGGSHPETLYNLASQVNGFSAFDKDEEINHALGYVPSCFNPYLIYAVNPEVSGQGSITLPQIRSPHLASYWFSMTIQDNGPLNMAQSVKLEWSNPEAPNFQGSSVTYWYSESQVLKRNVSNLDVTTWEGNHIGNWIGFDQADYNVTLQWNYLDTKPRRLQIRIFGRGSDSSVDHWMPFDN